jgi:hypothetical protein
MTPEKRQKILPVEQGLEPRDQTVFRDTSVRTAACSETGFKLVALDLFVHGFQKAVAGGMNVGKADRWPTLFPGLGFHPLPDLFPDEKRDLPDFGFRLGAPLHG